MIGQEIRDDDEEKRLATAVGQSKCKEHGPSGSQLNGERSPGMSFGK